MGSISPLLTYGVPRRDRGAAPTGGCSSNPKDAPMATASRPPSHPQGRRKPPCYPHQSPEVTQDDRENQTGWKPVATETFPDAKKKPEERAGKDDRKEAAGPPVSCSA